VADDRGRRDADTAPRSALDDDEIDGDDAERALALDDVGLAIRRRPRRGARPPL